MKKRAPVARFFIQAVPVNAEEGSCVGLWRRNASEVRMVKFLSILAALLAMAWCDAAQAFCNPSYFMNTTVTGEYYDAASDRYYLAWSSPTSFGGCFPPTVSQHPPEGTTATALHWTTAAHALGCNINDPHYCSLSRRVCEFEAEGQPRPASRFYTINASECQALRRPGSGWTYLPMTTGTEVGGPSLAAFEVDPSTGTCRPEHVPVGGAFPIGSRPGMEPNR